MALLLLIVLYVAIPFALLRIIALHTSYTLFGLALNIVSGLAMLVLPLVVYSIIDLYFTKRAVERIGRKWCGDHNVNFVRVELHKKHFSVLCEEGGQRRRAKFRAHFILASWRVKKVEWLTD